MEFLEEIILKMATPWDNKVNLIDSPLALSIWIFVKSYERNMNHECPMELIPIHFKIGQNRFKDALSLLRRNGILITKKIKDKKGRFLKVSNIFSDLINY